MRIDTRVHRVAAVAALVVLSGCFRLSRESPPLQQFVLSGAANAAAGPVNTNTVSTMSARPGVTLGIRRLSLASYLSTLSIVVRRGENEIVTSDFHRWGESLDEAINRVVAANLSAMPSITGVNIAPWHPRAAHTYLVQLHVTRFEGTMNQAGAANGILVRADWDIIRPVDGRLLVRGSTDDREGSWTTGNYGSLVAALDGALARLAGDVGGCIARFTNDTTPPASCATARGAD